MSLVTLSYVLLFGVEAAVLAGVPIPSDLQMLLLATLTLYIGCHLGLTAIMPKEAALTHKDAATMPFFAGGALVALYLAFKYAPKYIINALLKAYFILFGVIGITALLQPFFDSISVLKPKRRADGKLVYLFAVPAIPGVLDERLLVTTNTLLAAAAATALCAWYALTNHWLSNNSLAISFCVLALANLNLPSYSVSALLLSGLFLYDIFMVFGTKQLLGDSIMVSVALQVDGPIKLLFPRFESGIANLPHAEAASLLPVEEGAPAAPAGRPFSLLGLGDIVFPGAFLALLLRFDLYQALQREGRPAAPAPPAATAEAAQAALPQGGNFPRPYFNAGVLSYTLGLAVTSVVMHTFESAQPALLYLVPAVLLTSLAQAAGRGELRALLAYHEAGEEKAAEKQKEGEAQQKQKEGEGSSSSASSASSAAGATDAQPAQEEAAQPEAEADSTGASGSSSLRKRKDRPRL